MKKQFTNTLVALAAFTTLCGAQDASIISKAKNAIENHISTEVDNDQAITQRIRKALVEDTILSSKAKNVAIVTKNGKVTLRGSVDSKAEKSIVVAKAKVMAGADKVVAHLDIAG